MKLRDRDIVCVGFADWQTELKTNQHHLMSRLARDNRVLFVESLGLRQPQLSSRDLKRILRRLRRGVAPPREVDGVHVLSPLVIPLHRFAAVRALNARLLPWLVGRAARRLGMSSPILWSYNPQAEALLDVLEPSLVVYHCVDDVAAQKGVDAASFRAAEKRFVERADAVLTTSEPLAERLRQISDKVHGDAERGGHRAVLARARAGPRGPGARGAAGPADRLHRRDRGHQARRRAAGGAGSRGDPTGPSRSWDRWAPATRAPTSPVLGREPNVHLLGLRAYDALPDVLRGADAALIPYSLNELTASIFPMKVYEYLAAGLPVVATPLPSLRGVEGIVTARRRRVHGRAARGAAGGRLPGRARRALPARGRPLLGRAHRRDRGGAERPWLTCSWHRSRPTLGGGMRMRTYGIVRALAASGPVDFLYPDLGEAKPSREYQTHGQPRPAPGRARPRLRPRARLRHRRWRVACRRRSRAACRSELVAAVEELADTPGRRRVIADGPIAAALASRLARRRPVIYNAHNLESAFRREARAAGDAVSGWHAAPLRAAHPGGRPPSPGWSAARTCRARSSWPRTRR